MLAKDLVRSHVDRRERVLVFSHNPNQKAQGFIYCLGVQKDLCDIWRQLDKLPAETRSL